MTASWSRLTCPGRLRRIVLGLGTVGAGQIASESSEPAEPSRHARIAFSEESRNGWVGLAASLVLWAGSSASMLAAGRPNETLRQDQRRRSSRTRQLELLTSRRSGPGNGARATQSTMMEIEKSDGVPELREALAAYRALNRAIGACAESHDSELKKVLSAARRILSEYFKSQGVSLPTATSPSVRESR